MNLAQKLRELANAIAGGEDPRQAQKDWELAGRLLTRTPADQAAVRAAVESQDAAALDAIVAGLESPEAEAPRPAPTESFSKEDKDAALRAFKQRLRILRRSDESRLGGRYTSAGRRSNIDAIEPPDAFPRGIWKALAAEGRLVDTGQGFYGLPE